MLQESLNFNREKTYRNGQKIDRRGIDADLENINPQIQLNS